MNVSQYGMVFSMRLIQALMLLASPRGISISPLTALLDSSMTVFALVTITSAFLALHWISSQLELFTPGGIDIDAGFTSMSLSSAYMPHTEFLEPRMVAKKTTSFS